MYREFAGLKTRQDIQEFANRFGDIRNHWDDPPHRDDGTPVLGRTLSTWMKEVGDMRVLVELWDHIKSLSHVELRIKLAHGGWTGVRDFNSQVGK